MRPLNKKDIIALGKISDVCYNHEIKNNGEPCGFSYREISKLSGMNIPMCKIFIRKCKERKIVKEAWKSHFDRPEKAFFFESDVIDNYIWENELKDLQDSARFFIKDRSIINRILS